MLERLSIRNFKSSTGCGKVRGKVRNLHFVPHTTAGITINVRHSDGDK